MSRVGLWPIFALVWSVIAGIGIGLDPQRAVWICTGVMVGVNVTMTIVLARSPKEPR